MIIIMLMSIIIISLVLKILNIVYNKHILTITQARKQKHHTDMLEHTEDYEQFKEISKKSLVCNSTTQSKDAFMDFFISSTSNSTKNNIENQILHLSK